MRVRNIDAPRYNADYVSHPISTEQAYYNMEPDSGKITKGLACLAVIGIACAGQSVMKKHNINPAEKLKGTFDNIKDKLSDKPPQDPIIKALNGKRDSSAVQLYNSLTAKKKLASLEEKAASGEFAQKSREALQHIKDNAALLQKSAEAFS